MFDVAKPSKKTLFFMVMVPILAWLWFLPALMSAQNPSYGMRLDQPAPAFSLHAVNGQPHKLEQHLGRYVVLYFGYVNCDEVCHNQVGVMFNLNHQSPASLPLDFVFVTMDPERDTPETLARYFEQFGDNFYGLYGDSLKATQSLANRYHAPFSVDRTDAPAQSGEYELTHPGFLYVIDRQGQLRYLYPNQHLRYDKILQDIERLENA